MRSVATSTAAACQRRLLSVCFYIHARNNRRWQAAAVLIARDRIAAAFFEMLRISNTGMSGYAQVRLPKVPLRLRDPGPRLVQCSLGPTSPQPKWHLDWFSRFAADEPGRRCPGRGDCPDQSCCFAPFFTQQVSKQAANVIRQTSSASLPLDAPAACYWLRRGGDDGGNPDWTSQLCKRCWAQCPPPTAHLRGGNGDSAPAPPFTTRFPLESTPNQLTIGSTISEQLIGVPDTQIDRQTDIQTDHATCIIMYRTKPHLYVLSAGDAT